MSRDHDKMATERTPVKTRCVLCDCDKTGHNYTVLGKRGWKNEELGEMVESLSGESIRREMEESGGFMCTRCTHNMKASFEFVSLLKRFTPRVPKRMPKTPLQEQEERSGKMTTTARKKRLFDSPAAGVCVDSDSELSSPRAESVFVIPRSTLTRPSPSPRLRRTENIPPGLTPLTSPLSPKQKDMLLAAVDLGSVEELLPGIKEAMKTYFISEIRDISTDLSSMQENLASCLQQRTMERLKHPDFFSKIYNELKSRHSFLFRVLSAVASSTHDGDSTGLMGPLVMVYSVLLFKRNNRLSAFQRAMSLVLAKGSATEECVSACNKLGITLSFNYRLNVMDECVKETKSKAKELMKAQPCCLCSLVGDNCDIRVRPRQVSSQHQVKDCHFFGMLLIFSRLATELSGLNREIPVEIHHNEHLNPAHYILSSNEQRLLLESYKVMLGRLMVKNFPAFKWMEDVLPRHIPHRFQQQMSRKSSVIPVRLILKNESKYEDCVWILHEAREMLTDVFEGNDDQPDETPFFGDQLTRDRLHNAQGMRVLNLPPQASLKDVGPFFCTLWHIKQDFLEKSYKLLWKSNSHKDKGCLMFFKHFLRTSYVNGKVKNNYRAHEQLFLIVGEFFLMEQVMEHFQMENYGSWPVGVAETTPNLSLVGRKVIADRLLMDHLRRCGYAAILDVGQEERPDFVMQYANNLSQRVLHLLHLNDMAKEGDLERLILSLKMNVPYFFSHSTKSKYFIECLDMLQKVKFMASEQMQLRLLEGSFCNKQGGVGRNVETDLVMEHSVRNKKDLIRSLGSNKKDQAIQRITLSADTIADIVANVRTCLDIPSRGGFTTRVILQEDTTRIKECLRDLRPFAKQPGRQLGQIRVPTSSITTPLMEKMKVNMARTLKRLATQPDQLSQEVAEEEERQEDQAGDGEPSDEDYESDEDPPDL